MFIQQLLVLSRFLNTTSSTPHAVRRIASALSTYAPSTLLPSCCVVHSCYQSQKSHFLSFTFFISFIFFFWFSVYFYSFFKSFFFLYPATCTWFQQSIIVTHDLNAGHSSLAPPPGCRSRFDITRFVTCMNHPKYVLFMSYEQGLGLD